MLSWLYPIVRNSPHGWSAYLTGGGAGEELMLVRACPILKRERSSVGGSSVERTVLPITGHRNTTVQTLENVAWFRTIGLCRNCRRGTRNGVQVKVGAVPALADL